MDNFIIELLLIIFITVFVAIAVLSHIVLIGPDQCGIQYHLGKPQTVLLPGMHFKSMMIQVKRIRMDENTWESELNMIRNQFPEFNTEIEAFKSKAKGIYGSRLKEPHGRFAAIICSKCNNKIEINLDEYK